MLRSEKKDRANGNLHMIESDTCSLERWLENQKEKKIQWMNTSTLNMLVRNIKVSSQSLGNRKKNQYIFFYSQPTVLPHEQNTSDSCSAAYIPCISLNINFSKRIGKNLKWTWKQFSRIIHWCLWIWIWIHFV